MLDIAYKWMGMNACKHRIRVKRSQSPGKPLFLLMDLLYRHLFSQIEFKEGKMPQLFINIDMNIFSKGVPSCKLWHFP